MNIPVGSIGSERPVSEVSEGIPARLIPAGRMLPFFLVTALFFLWAIPNNLNDILIRQFMKSFEINRLQAGLVQSAFYIGYFRWLSRRGASCGARGTRRASSSGCVSTASAAFCFGRRPWSASTRFS